MSRIRRFPDWAKATVGALALALAAGAAVACGEDGKTAPARCADPPLPIYDIQSAGVPNDDNARYVGDDPQHPCITEIGHAVSSIGTETGGTGSSGTAAGGTAGKSSSAGSGGKGGTAGTGGK